MLYGPVGHKFQAAAELPHSLTAYPSAGRALHLGKSSDCSFFYLRSCDWVTYVPLSSVRTLCNPMHRLSVEFSRREYWSGLPLPTLGGLLHPGIEHIPAASPVSAVPPRNPTGAQPLTKQHKAIWVLEYSKVF